MQNYITISQLDTLKHDFSVVQLLQSAIKANRVWILKIPVAEE